MLRISPKINHPFSLSAKLTDWNGILFVVLHAPSWLMEFYKHESEMGIPGFLCVFINGLETKYQGKKRKKNEWEFCMVSWIKWDQTIATGWSVASWFWTCTIFSLLLLLCGDSPSAGLSTTLHF